MHNCALFSLFATVFLIFSSYKFEKTPLQQKLIPQYFLVYFSRLQSAVFSNRIFNRLNESFSRKKEQENRKTVILYTLKHANPDSTQNVLLLKNPQFLPNHNETLLK